MENVGTKVVDRDIVPLEGRKGHELYNQGC